jgi:hypothetical protein
MKLLTRIANLCNTDKGTVVSECHGYTEFYHDIFNKCNNRYVNILEIGVCDGGSLKMYDAFFNGKCNIYALDIEDKSKYDTDNIHTFICDQGSREDLKNFKDKIGDIKFDFIIDDGSHICEHQTTSFYCLHDLLKKDGVYIIEDLHTYEWDDVNNSPLYSLIFNTPFTYLSPEESDYLYNKIDTVQIWAKTNINLKYVKNNKSITSAIKLKH